MQKKKSLNVFLLTMICIATILSVKNWAFTAEFGLASVFFLSIAVICFFIPCSLISAELATGWPQKGGIYIWVREALGHKLGFLAIWLLWIENIVWYPTILSFIAGTLAYTINPALSDHKTYTFITILIVFWLMTLLNLKGMKFSGWISTLGVILGTIIPGGLIIILGISWFSTGNPMEIDFNFKDLIPSFSSPSEFAFLSGVMLSFAGMEMPAVHANDVEKPQKDYPRAIFFSAAIIILFTLLGTLSIAIIIPQDKINLLSAGIEAIKVFLETYHLQSLVPFISILIVIGALGGVSTWIVGPSKGLLAAAEKGDLPHIFHKTNKNGMPTFMLISQAVVVSILASIFLYMPTVSSSFWVLIVLAAQLYLIMYSLMFVSAIILRYKAPNKKRAYKIPFGNTGMWITATLGLISSIFSIILGFFPPQQLDMGGLTTFLSILILGILIFITLPFLIIKKK